MKSSVAGFGGNIEKNQPGTCVVLLSVSDWGGRKL